MSNIKLPIQNKSKTVDFKRSTSNPIISTNHIGDNFGNTSKIVLPITEIKKITTPIRDVILRAKEDFALSIFDTGYPSFAYGTSTMDLIEVSPLNNNGRLFSDIFPRSSVYTGSISVLWRNIEEFYEFLSDNKFYIGFLIYLYNVLITNLAYQSSLLAMVGMSFSAELPKYAEGLSRRYNRLIKIFSNHQLRGMWWLNISADLRVLMRKLVRISKIIWNIVSKFYLVSVLVVCVGFLQYAAPKTTNITTMSTTVQASGLVRQSVLEAYLQQNSISSADKSAPSQNGTGYSLLTTPIEDIDKNAIPSNLITKYTVKDGDTLEQLATLYNVTIESIANNNTISANGLEAGQELSIPWVDAIIYNIKAGDNLDEVAKRYKLDTITISSINSDYLASNGFKEGNQILIPGISFEDYTKINNDLALALAKDSSEAKAIQAKDAANAKEIDGKKKLISEAKGRAKDNNVDLEKSSCGLIWPTSTKNISQYPSKVHMALDIANRQLPDIYAAANGKVVFAGWDNSGYGNMILIDHGDGMKTRYAHNTELYVKVGDSVTQGQSISKMGSTGRSTGPHLHYEVIESGKLINPLTCY